MHECANLTVGGTLCIIIIIKNQFVHNLIISIITFTLHSPSYIQRLLQSPADLVLRGSSWPRRKCKYLAMTAFVK